MRPWWLREVSGHISIQIFFGSSWARIRLTYSICDAIQLKKWHNRLGSRRERVEEKAGSSELHIDGRTVARPACWPHRTSQNQDVEGAPRENIRTIMEGQTAQNSQSSARQILRNKRIASVYTHLYCYCRCEDGSLQCTWSPATQSEAKEKQAPLSRFFLVPKPW